jgi:hypothetical protein
MEKQDFRALYTECSSYGWVPGDPKEDEFLLYEARERLINKYIGNCSSSNDLHIFIGEAPPDINQSSSKSKSSTYFYDPQASANTPYLRALATYFLPNNKNRTKQDILSGLAEKGVIVFDIFPFPVKQKTAVRKNVRTNGDGTSSFEKFLSGCFQDRFDDLLSQVPGKNYQTYLYAPLITSIQFLNWAVKNQLSRNSLRLTSFEPFYNYSEPKLSKSLEIFMKKINQNQDYQFDKTPIFIDGSGSPNLRKFFNGHFKG